MIFVGFLFNFRIRIHPNKKSEQLCAQLNKNVTKTCSITVPVPYWYLTMKTS